jgi:hypothetical protein
VSHERRTRLGERGSLPEEVFDRRKDSHRDGGHPRRDVGGRFVLLRSDSSDDRYKWLKNFMESTLEGHTRRWLDELLCAPREMLNIVVWKAVGAKAIHPNIRIAVFRRNVRGGTPQQQVVGLFAICFALSVDEISCPVGEFVHRLLKFDHS